MVCFLVAVLGSTSELSYSDNELGSKVGLKAIMHLRAKLPLPNC